MDFQLHGTFLMGLFVGGLLAEWIGDFMLIVSSSIALAAAVFSTVEWLRRAEPQWDRAVGLGTIAGFAIGVLLAMIDAGVGG